MAALASMLPTPYRIERARWELGDVFTLDLLPADGGERLHFLPGQFNMLYAFGLGEVAISISGDPASNGPLIHTIRAVGPVTRAIGELRAGDMLGVRGPFGSAWPVVAAEGEDVVIVTGGVGLVPLRPAIYHILNNRRRYGRVCLYYGARTPADMLYIDELHTWRGRFDLEVEVTVDRANEDWTGRVGVVTKLIPDGRFDPANTVAFICGPEVMMRYTVMALNARGVSDERIYVSMERNMKCAIGFCGHCQFGPDFVCKDGPVFRYDHVAARFHIPEF